MRVTTATATPRAGPYHVPSRAVSAFFVSAYNLFAIYRHFQSKTHIGASFEIST